MSVLLELDRPMDRSAGIAPSWARTVDQALVALMLATDKQRHALGVAGEKASDQRLNELIDVITKELR